MHKPPKPINAHRLARLIVWAQAMIVWAAAVFFGDAVCKRRHIRQRYRLLSLDTLARLVRNLMIARAVELFSVRRGRAPSKYLPPGFRRRRRLGNILRQAAGARLRRFLRAGDFAARFARLAQIIANIDEYCRKFLLPRARRGLTRLYAILLVRPPHDPARSLAAPAIAFADSS
jgi:hypothetical protein